MKKRKNNIVLINPWIYDFAAFDLWVKPLGLLYIDALLRRNGYETHLIDCLDRYHPELLKLQGRRRPKRKRYGTGPFHKEVIEKPEVYRNIKRRYGRYGITEEIFQEELRALESPDVILVTSGMTYWYPGPFRVIRLVRECFPGTPIILGGIYATLCPDHAKEHSGADTIVVGEGEQEALRLVDELTGQRSSYWPDPENLDSYPWPDYTSGHRLEWMPLLTSRGCPYRCSYCASHKLYRAFRQRHPQNVFEEIEYAYRTMKVRNFVFYDDALLVRAESHIHPLLDEVTNRNMSCTFHTPNGLSPRDIDEVLADKLFCAGFKTVRLSFETGDIERHKGMNSQGTAEELAFAIDCLECAGYQTKELEVYVLVGLPGQSFEEMMERIVFVAKCGAKIRLALYSPIPGTMDWEKGVQLFDFDAQADPLLHNNTLLPFFPSGNPSLEQLQGLVKILNSAIDQGVNVLRPSTLSKTFLNALEKWD
ncbi:MAG: radical SAM protein [Gemmatimonadota bacterium]|nr:MAG: radical SAM protein [Gemmatimonadota bacterium]